MANLVNPKTGQVFEVADDKADEAARANGLVPASPEQMTVLAKQQAYEAKPLATKAGDAYLAGIQGFAGVANEAVSAVGLGTDAERDQIRAALSTPEALARREEHPIAHGIGVAAPSMALGAGLGAVGTGLGGFVATQGLESAASGASQEASDAALEGRDFDLSNAGKNAAIDFAAGGAFYGLTKAVTAGNLFMFGLGDEITNKALPSGIKAGAGNVKRAADPVEAAAGEGLEDAVGAVEARSVASQVKTADAMPKGPERDAMLVRTADKQYDRMATEGAKALDENSELMGRLGDTSASKMVEKRLRETIPEKSPAQTMWATELTAKLDEFGRSLHTRAGPYGPLAEAESEAASTIAKSAGMAGIVKNLDATVRNAVRKLDSTDDNVEWFLTARRAKQDLQKMSAKMARVQNPQDQALHDEVRGMVDELQRSINDGTTDKALFGTAAEIERDINNAWHDKWFRGIRVAEEDLSRKVDWDYKTGRIINEYDPAKLRTFLKGDRISRQLSQGRLDMVLEGFEDMARAHEKHGTASVADITRLRKNAANVRASLGLADDISVAKNSESSPTSLSDMATDWIANKGAKEAIKMAVGAVGFGMGGPVGAGLGYVASEAVAPKIAQMLRPGMKKAGEAIGKSDAFNRAMGIAKARNAQSGAVYVGGSDAQLRKLKGKALTPDRLEQVRGQWIGKSSGGFDNGARYYRVHKADEPIGSVLVRKRKDRWVDPESENFETQPDGISSASSLESLNDYKHYYNMAVQDDDLILEMRGRPGGEDADRHASRVIPDAVRVIGTGKDFKRISKGFDSGEFTFDDLIPAERQSGSAREYAQAIVDRRKGQSGAVVIGGQGSQAEAMIRARLNGYERHQAKIASLEARKAAGGVSEELDDKIALLRDEPPSSADIEEALTALKYELDDAGDLAGRRLREDLDAAETTEDMVKMARDILARRKGQSGAVYVDGRLKPAPGNPLLMGKLKETDAGEAIFGRLKEQQAEDLFGVGRLTHDAVPEVEQLAFNPRTGHAEVRVTFPGDDGGVDLQRTFDFSPRLGASDPNRFYVTHDRFFMPDADKGKKLASAYLREMAPVYRDMKINRIVAPEMVDDGVVVWPGFGFRPSPWVEKQILAAAKAAGVATESLRAMAKTLEGQGVLRALAKKEPGWFKHWSVTPDDLIKVMGPARGRSDLGSVHTGVGIKDILTSPIGLTAGIGGAALAGNAALRGGEDDERLSDLAVRIAGIDAAARSRTRVTARNLAGSGPAILPREEDPNAPNALSRFASNHGDPQAAFEAKRKTLEQEAVDPTLIYEVIASVLGDMPRVNSELYQKVAARAAEGIRYLRSHMPTGLQMSLLYPNGTPPSESALREWATMVNTFENPETVLDDIDSGTATLLQMTTLKNVHPDLYEQFRTDTIGEVGANFADVPISTKLQLDMLFEADGMAGPMFSSDASRMIGEAMQMQAEKPKNEQAGQAPAEIEATSGPSGVEAIKTSVTNRGS